MNLTVNIIQPDGVNPPIDLTVDAGGIVVGADSNLSPSNTLTVAVTDNESVNISVNQDGFHSYSMTIDNVYTADKEIYIILVPIINDIEDADYNRPYPLHFFFVNPCSFEVDFYSATSFGGNISWYVNNNLYLDNVDKGVVDFCVSGVFQIKQRNLTYSYPNNLSTNVLWDKQWANTDNASYVLPDQVVGVGETGNTVPGVIDSLSTYLELDTVTNITVIEFRPSITLDLSSPTDQIDNACCYTKGEELTILPEITLNRVDASLDAHSLEYLVLSPSGLEVTLAKSSYTLDEEDLSTVFTLDELGTYTITATVTDTACGNSFSRTIEIETCNFVTLDYADCNSYVVSNKSSNTNVSILVTDLGTNTVLISNQAINFGESYLLEFTTTSLFSVTVSYTKNLENKTEVYILNNYCGLDDCISSYILNLLCGDSNRCNPCPDETELNQLLLLSHTYFMKLNKEYGWNNFYSGLDNSKLEELTTIKQVMDKLSIYCSRKSCNSGAFQKTYQTDGPYDFVGSGSNAIVGCTCTPISQGSYYYSNPGYCKSCGD